MFVSYHSFSLVFDWLCLALYDGFQWFGSVAADCTIGGCLNTFTPNLQAYGRIWLQALAHLGRVAVSVIRAARVMAACLHVPSADTYETVKIPAQVCDLHVAEHDNSNRRLFLVEVSGLLCIVALLIPVVIDYHSHPLPYTYLLTTIPQE